jgi:DNA-directed RNA polymerase specialized sigma24 family protein
MIEKQMILLAQKQEDWIRIVKSFGCRQVVAEDLVQEMYIKIYKRLGNDLNIMYDDKEINYYYVYRTLHTLFLDLKRKEQRVKKVYIEDVDIDRPVEDIDYESAYQKVEEELGRAYWYNRKVFEIINGGESVADLSRNSGINYYSLYNTYRKMKEQLKKLL